MIYILMLNKVLCSQKLGKLYCSFYNTNFIKRILDFLILKKFIKSYIIKCNKLIIYLKYFNNFPAINNIKYISKPSKKVYINIKEMLNIINMKYLGLHVISTNIGIIDIKEAYKKNIGGELLFYIS
ncbi:30S ribosomal protein S8 [Candidatus Vidania fulgoroideorum]